MGEEDGIPTSFGRYRSRHVGVGALLTSVLYYAGFITLFFLVVGGYLYLSRTAFTRPITGVWVGVLADESDGKGTAIVLDTSVDPFQIFRLTLAGSVRMCSARLQQDFQLEQTRTVSADTLGLVIASESSPESGRIFGALRDGEFQALYDDTIRGLQGKLRRGTSADYQQSCASLRQSGS